MTAMLRQRGHHLNNSWRRADMRWTEQKARMLYGIELRSCRVRFAFTAGMGPDTWVESNTGSRRDQLSCPNSPARRQRIVYKYPVTPPPSFFRSGSLFRIFHLFISRTAILPYCITFAICTVSPARSGPDSDGYHLSSAAGGGPLPFRVTL
jgi:hypothetical protein